MATGIKALLRRSLAQFNGKRLYMSDTEGVTIGQPVATEEFGETCRQSRYEIQCLQ